MMKGKLQVYFQTALLILLLIMISSRISAGENNTDYVPTQNGISLSLGSAYSVPGTIDFYMVSGFVLFDYDKIWNHKAPENLRFKIEGTLGAAHDNSTHLVTSVNIFALHYLDILSSQGFKPYVEGGIGIIYTDFQVRGQGLRINFNPQIGLGAEITNGSDDTIFIALRLHHLSNANLDDDNRGVNSVMGMIGFYF
jgi:lipid A 3-O-deacylase